MKISVACQTSGPDKILLNFYNEATPIGSEANQLVQAKFDCK